MKTLRNKFISRFGLVGARFGMVVLGMSALIWFLIRVIPKPSRASYPCQQAAFPLACAFVLWLTGVVGSYFGLKYLGQIISQRRWLIFGSSAACALFIAFWSSVFPLSFVASNAATPAEYTPAVGFDWKPGPSNQPIGDAKGIFPGRVVMSRDARATKWAGRWNLNEDQWWLDKNTDVDVVFNMLSVTLRQLTGANTDEAAWQKIFAFYNQNARGLSNRSHQAGEVVAIKINLNNSSETKTDNQIDASPQMVLAMVRHLVYKAGVPQKDILIYDARRPMFPQMLLTVWKEFKDVRFMQENAPTSKLPVNPAYGDHTGLEGAIWVEGVSYSAQNFDKAKLIPKQVMDATYLINLALLKLHSYPYNYMEDGDEGQTALTMTGKNHAGSIKGTSELHAILNTKKLGTKNAYSPLVDLAAAPNLGAKTILYVLDGLYCGRKWRSYPSHFPNPPFNNKTEPYENPEWPACVLASFDGVAIQSVGLDIMYAQSQNNFEKSYHNVPRILLRDNADDFLREMAIPEQAPSGTKYMQGGKPVKSLGVFEHWDNDRSMKYSRNLNPASGKGIEFVYLPL
jgi:uncharacterized protein (DUF362 family)